jgi:uncharacterized coiled-coil protein SlyX
MNKIIDTLKHAIIEDDPDPKPTGHADAVETQPASAAAPMPPAAIRGGGTQGLGPDGEHAYQKILGKTDFDATQVSAIIHKYLDPLAAIPISAMSESIKFKTAVLQAKAQEGLTEEKILATFDGLKLALQNEQEAFAASAEATKAQELTNRQKKVQEINDAITQKQKEISQLQQRLTQVSTELVEAQSKIQRAESQFTIAAQRRALEIEQQKVHYVSLLQG